MAPRPCWRCSPGVGLAGFGAIALAACGNGSRFEALWLPIVRVVAAAADPVRLRLAAVPWIRRSLRDDRLPSRVVLLGGVAIGVRMAFGIDGHVLDEVPLALLAGWGVAIVWLARQVGTPTASRVDTVPGHYICAPRSRRRVKEKHTVIACPRCGYQRDTGHRPAFGLIAPAARTLIRRCERHDQAALSDDSPERTIGRPGL